jgi:hypothetical protein
MGNSKSSRARPAADEEQVERLVVALCERLAEVLPRDKFEVVVEHRHAIRIRGIGLRSGDTHWLSPLFLWRSESPVEYRLQLFLEPASRGVQEFVSRRYRPWPTTTAKSKISIGEENILIWWGGESNSDAVVALRPIVRSEIGL